MLTRRYEVDAVLGVGGFGAVYRVKPLDAADRAPMALKVVQQDASDPQLITRLKDEASLLSMLRHPSVPLVHDLVQLDDGRWAMLMEYVPGQDLRALLRAHGPMPTRAVMGIVSQIASALDSAWNDPGPLGPLCLVHRDVKPANIVLGPDGTVKLLDFGAARADVDRLTSTLVGFTLGTGRYMAPEAFAAEAGPYSDVFSLGVTILVLLGSYPQDPLGIATESLYDRSLDELLLEVEPTEIQTLIRDMLNLDAGLRPSARGVARRASSMAEKLPGPTLQSWAGEHVDPSSSAMETDDPTLGSVVAVTVRDEEKTRSRRWRPMARIGMAAMVMGGMGMIASGLFLLLATGAGALWMMP